MFLVVTIVINVVGCMVAAFYAFVQIMHVIKSSDRRAKHPASYLKIAFWAICFGVCFVLDAVLAVMYSDSSWLVKGIILSAGVSLWCLMYEVFDIVDYVIFHDSATGTASIARKFARRHDWI